MLGLILTAALISVASAQICSYSNICASQTMCKYPTLVRISVKQGLIAVFLIQVSIKYFKLHLVTSNCIIQIFGDTNNSHMHCTRR